MIDEGGLVCTTKGSLYAAGRHANFEMLLAAHESCSSASFLTRHALKLRYTVSSLHCGTCASKAVSGMPWCVH
jgi:hypothetical protein